ncbi:hypothetical protein GcM1_200014 [Golovinomyces cichoracearum]|uniref:Developmental regulatory protein wetA n=1 Tax=Golovinomyces cichoracearum TaxID=62708 RepID=A0A420IYK3_9PEZI|nr:hypothetical protein GcM1_200014 [Golovinomyces cichoracearum]
MLKCDLRSSGSQTLAKSKTSSPDLHGFGRTQVDSLKFVADKELSIDNETMSLLASQPSDKLNFTYPLSIDASNSSEKISNVKVKPPSDSNKLNFVTPSPKQDSLFENQFTKDFEQKPLKKIDYEQQGNHTFPLTPQSGQSHSHILRCNSSLDSPSVCRTEPSFQSSLVWNQENPLISTYQSSQSFDQIASHLTAEVLALQAQTRLSHNSTDSCGLEGNFSPANFNEKMNLIHEPSSTNVRLLRQHSSLNDISLKYQKVKKHDKCQLDDYHRSVSPCLQIRKHKSTKFNNGEKLRSGTTNGGSSINATCNFVNYTPRDSLKILTGVAPSGSSKTKARREKEALEKRERFSQAALRAILAAGGDVDCLLKEGFRLDE